MNNNEIIERSKRMWPEYFDGTAIKLTNNEKLIKRYGKYNPQLCFLLNEDGVMIDWMDIKMHSIDLNIRFDAVCVDWIPGEFWVSKKGTRCFRPTEQGKHLLLRCTWGGCFESSRGDEFESTKNKAVFAYRAQSNGGGSGYNYYVFDKDFFDEVSVEDI